MAIAKYFFKLPFNDKIANFSVEFVDENVVTFPVIFRPFKNFSCCVIVLNFVRHPIVAAITVKHRTIVMFKGYVHKIGDGCI